LNFVFLNYPNFNLAALVPGTVESIPVPKGDFWIFAYGSLMWNPGFEFIKSVPGLVHGYHRRLCLWSVRYRGNTKQPGLVLGLARGGSCRGYAYRIDKNHQQEVLKYLCERELITGAYDAKICQVNLASGDKINATTFVSKIDHPHFAHKMTTEDTVRIVNRAKGYRGCNREYVLNTVKRMDQMEIHNTELHRIAKQLESIR